MIANSRSLVIPSYKILDPPLTVYEILLYRQIVHPSSLFTSACILSIFYDNLYLQLILLSNGLLFFTYHVPHSDYQMSAKTGKVFLLASHVNFSINLTK